MNVVLLSGGSGTRLWPLSNSVRSKQFLKVLRDGNGRPCSMVQRVVEQIRTSALADGGHLVVATGAAQVGIIEAQTGGACEIVTEPERRDTMPAIMLACAYLASEKACSDDEPVLVMPIDSYVEDAYFERARRLGEAVECDAADIVLMGVEPTYPSEKYGYIVPEPGAGGEALAVARFVEKPSEAKAKELIDEGALWNCGAFAFRLGYTLDLLRSMGEEASYESLSSRYGELEKTSFDYGVVERAERVAVVPYAGSWKDLGTWNTLCEEMADEVSGDVVLGEGCENVHVVNELGVPIVALGLRDTVIAATHDGVIVSDKHATSYSKPYVEKVQAGRPMQENRAWGSYEVLGSAAYASGGKCIVKHLLVKAGKGISYQRHFKRMEVWSIVDGEGELVLDGVFSRVGPGDVVNVPLGALHGIKAVEDLHIVEVQIGSDLVEEDIERLEWPAQPTAPAEGRAR